MSQQELGDMIGVTKVSICGYENGTRTPSLETFCILADIFETTTDYLLGTVEDCGTAGQEKLQYIQRNLQKLDATQLKKAETILKTVFDDIFDDDDEE